MDPNTAYKMMTEHFEASEYSEAYDMAIGLIRWVKSGGFLPQGETDPIRVIAKVAVVARICGQLIEA